MEIINHNVHFIDRRWWFQYFSVFLRSFFSLFGIYLQTEIRLTNKECSLFRECRLGLAVGVVMDLHFLHSIGQKNSKTGGKGTDLMRLTLEENLTVRMTLSISKFKPQDIFFLNIGKIQYNWTNFNILIFCISEHNR